MDTKYISAERIKQIACLSRELWAGFASSKSDKFSTDGELFLNNFPGPLNPHAIAFLRYCAVSRLNAHGAAVVLTCLRGEKTAPSWLWHKNWQIPLVLLDLKQIQRKVKDERQRKKIATRLILHETGHAVMHFESLRLQSKAGSKMLTSGTEGSVPSVSDQQEEEAWVFCGMITGLALGQMARRSRPHFIDRAWPQCC